MVRTDLDPALISLLTYAVIQNPKSGFDKSGEPILFYKPGEFPNRYDSEFQMAPEARLVYQTDQLPLLLRTIAPTDKQLGLPFWPAALVHANAGRSLLLLIPILSIAIPLMRLLPLIYNWRVSRRLFYWYRQLKLLEDTIEETPTADQLSQKRHELECIDREVSKIRVPLYFSDRLYDLRGHIHLVRQRLSVQSVAIAAE